MKLEALAARGLVEMEPGPPARYRADARFTEIVESTRHEFATRRVSIITLIYSRPEDEAAAKADPVRAFADAFKLRKDK